MVWSWVFLICGVRFDIPYDIYKSGYKVGKSFILAAGPVVLFMAAIEAASHIPALVWMDSCQPKHLLMQLPILTSGIFCYSIFIPLAYRISIKRFEKVDL